MTPPATHEDLQPVTTQEIAAALARRAADRRAAQGRLAARHLSGRSLRTPGMAREHVGRHLTRWGMAPDRIADAQTIVAELAANAVQHTTSSVIVVAVSLQGRRIHVTVTDHGPHRPLTVQPIELGAESGRGLRIVAELADRWTVRRHGMGTRVTAVLRAETDAAGEKAEC